MYRRTVELPKDTMSSAEETENMKTFFHYQNSFLISKIMCTASQLGVIDLLKESGELLSSETVAERLKTSLTGMQTLLRACVGLKFLKVEWKDGKDFYGNTEFADLFLAKSSPKSQYYTMKFYSEHVHPSFQYLPEMVRDGNPEILSKHGISAQQFFEPLQRSKEGVENLSKFMNESWTLYSKEVVSSFDLSGFQLIYNLDGFSVGLAKELISTYPNCTVKVQFSELPEVVEKSKIFSEFSDDSQISFHEGDCFKDPLPEADLYILSKVIYDWSDEKCIQLLTKLFMACKPGGGVLVVESAVDEEISGRLSANLFSMLMLLHSGGKIRKPSEHHMLLNTAGFKDIQFKKGNVFDVILARK
ncbi:acetylserotonin O-methyltransferase-like [Erythrolamprus reginae]|uniref:acetylserotonin O-methyltransferase-like n=1 Tax=Erythrolamprus reginae TaxID=121349 RepID=UPI00396CD7D2